MRIVSLIENTPGYTGCAYEHGLCLYIETEHHRLLADTGASDAFIRNAEMLGIDLTAVDTVILSHGHYDHTGGVSAFARLNPDAAVYLQKCADAAFYHGEKYIGIDPAILQLPQIRLINGDLRIDDELFLFSGITGRRYTPESNSELTVKDENGTVRQDDFRHEQCLIITENDKRVLVSGCAHNGILNILDRYHDFSDKEPDMGISGFHMMKKGDYTPDEIRTVRTIAEELNRSGTIWYTGHCTGGPAFEMMRAIMGDKLKHIHSGMELLSDSGI